MGHSFSPEEKEELRQTGNLGKTVELTPKKGEPFRAYVSVDRLTNELVALRADRVQIPNEIKGVRLSEEQHRALTEGRPVQVEGMLSRHGKPFDATLQVNAEKRGIEFIFKDSLSNKERLKSSAKETPAVRQIAWLQHAALESGDLSLAGPQRQGDQARPVVSPAVRPAVRSSAHDPCASRSQGRDPAAR